MHDAADIGVIGVHGRMHGDHGALNGRQVALEQGPVQPHAHDG